MGRTYLATLADKVGVGVDEWRFSTYKSAMESFTRHDMSDADREQRQALVDAYYATMRRDVADGRKVEPGTVDRWIDDITAFTPELARDEGLVDALGRWDEVKKVVADLEGSRKHFTSPSSIGREAYPSTTWGEPDKVVVVYAEGECEMDRGINARQLERTFEALRNDRGVKAVVFRVNSPGGSPLASDVIAAAMRKCAQRKPVIVSQADVAASGGYWISMYGDEIVTQPTSITGSIGYIGGWVWDKGISEKVGVEGDFVKAGEHADLFFDLKLPILPVSIAHRALTDEERERVLGRMSTMYDGFIGKVAEGRDLDKSRVAEIAKGRVWTGTQAVDNGLADRIGGLDTAINVAIVKAHLDPDYVEVIHRNERGFFNFGKVNPAPWAKNLAWWRDDAGFEEDDADAAVAASTTNTFTWPFGSYDLLYLQELARNNGLPLCLIPPDFVPQEEE
jgi:protease-4